MLTAARWLAGHEIWLVAGAAPFLLIPGRWTVPALGLIALGWLCRVVARGRLSVATSADAPLAWLLLMSVVGVAVSVDAASADAASMVAFWRLLLGLAVFYSLANAANAAEADRGLRSLTWLLALGGAGLVLLTLVATRWDMVRLASLPALYDRLPALLADPEDGLGIHPRVMGMALAAVLPVLAAVGLFARGWPGALRAGAGLVALAMLLVLPFTQSPGAIVGAAVALAFLAVWRTRWALLALVPVAGALAFALARVDLAALALRMLALDDPAGIAIVLRLDMWGRAAAMIREAPFTGIGANLFPAIQTNFFPGFLLGPETHAHNVFLQVALDLGVPGLVAFVALLVAAGVMAVRALRRRPSPGQRALVAGLAAGLLSYVVSGQIDTLWQPKFGVLLWVLLGLLAAAEGVGRATSGLRPEVADGARAGQRGQLRTVLAWAGPPVLLGACLVLLPGVRERNLGTVRAHKVIYAARAGEAASDAAWEAAAERLRRAVDLGAGTAHTWGLLGSLAAWQGDQAAALDALRQQVALELAGDPVAAYAPFEALRRPITGEAGPGAAADLLQAHKHWINRYPGRAEPVVAAAIVHAEHLDQGDRAAALLRAALDRGAEPASLLEAALFALGG